MSTSFNDVPGHVNLNVLIYMCFIPLLALGLRSLVMLHTYSGFQKPPLRGDFEAQRHWMEITTQIPQKMWYTNSSENDLLYWGLDYPPLTAYHSFFMGKIAERIDPSWVELFASRGLETEYHKFFMRLTVLLSDSFTLIPSLLLIFPAIFEVIGGHHSPILVSALMSLCSPPLMLIDHGHFQYNCVSLGLYVFAMRFFLTNRDVLGTITFMGAVFYKQMELYHALPLFFYLLGKCIHSNFFTGMKKLLTLAISVILFSIVVLLPWTWDIQSLANVIHRMFPLKRGLYEDKVANFWCVSAIAVKWKQLCSHTSLLLLTTSATLVASLPVCLRLLIHPDKKLLFYAEAVVSLAFFLFSFQVHEKSILLPLVSVLCLLPFDANLPISFSISATLSMWPLLQKDGLCVATIAMLIFYYSVFKIATFYCSPFDKSSNRPVDWHLISMAVFFLVIAASFLLPPPARYPDLYPLAISVLGCVHFIFYYAILLVNSFLL